ncbi:MAG TPA: SPOR domain-containing protein [Xanthobacteraceae bacterium]|jgi:hypothetical protein
MADDPKSAPYRSHDPDGRAAGSPRPSGQVIADDPLAELARLIGQGDPFATFGRNSPRQPRREGATLPPADQRPTPARPQQLASDDGAAVPASDRSRRAFEYPAAQGDEEGYSDSRVHEQVPLAADHQGQYRDDARHDAEQYADATQDSYDSEQYYQDDVPLDPYEEEQYDDPPHATRRSWVMTALVLVGCALLGTVGAYAYRSFYPATSSTSPPVITADNSTPMKVVPAAPDGQTGKSIEDQLANAGKEQLVSKQEEPVTLQATAPQTAPAVVAPPPAMGQVAPAQQSATAPSALSTEPKKIRTVTIRPDAADTSGQPLGAPAPQPPAAAAPGEGLRAPAMTPSSKAVSGHNAAPLSLEPQTSEPASGTAARTQVATAPGARTPPEAAHGPTGGFLVQLASQKSEHEAVSSFRALQAKFPNELGGRQPIIRRADLGGKGVFYRTMVGPFASAHEASQFCASYKAAGGQCVVPSH